MISADDIEHTIAAVVIPTDVVVPKNFVVLVTTRGCHRSIMGFAGTSGVLVKFTWDADPIVNGYRQNYFGMLIGEVRGQCTIVKTSEAMCLKLRRLGSAISDGWEEMDRCTISTSNIDDFGDDLIERLFKDFQLTDDKIAANAAKAAKAAEAAKAAKAAEVAARLATPIVIDLTVDHTVDQIVEQFVDHTAAEAEAEADKADKADKAAEAAARLATPVPRPPGDVIAVVAHLPNALVGYKRQRPISGRSKIDDIVRSDNAAEAAARLATPVPRPPGDAFAVVDHLPKALVDSKRQRPISDEEEHRSKFDEMKFFDLDEFSELDEFNDLLNDLLNDDMKLSDSDELSGLDEFKDLYNDDLLDVLDEHLDSSDIIEFDGNSDFQFFSRR
jgi:hypothetical protein